jgi:putative lipoic acid-binding regulatory protein
MAEILRKVTINTNNPDKSLKVPNGVIRDCKSEEKTNTIDQRKREEGAYNIQQNTIQKTTIDQHESHQKPTVNSEDG